MNRRGVHNLWVMMAALGFAVLTVCPTPGKGEDGVVQQVRQRKALLWQQAETAFQQASRDVRRAVLEHRYDDARRALAHAQQTIDNRRDHARPPTAYDDLRREADATARFIDEDERKVERARRRRAMAEIGELQRTRRDAADRARRRKIDRLMDQVRRRRDQGRHDEAIRLLDALLAAVPRHEPARRLRADLAAAADDRHQRASEAARTRESARALADVRADEVPRLRPPMRYPDDWPAKAVRRSRPASAAPPEARTPVDLRRRLRRRLAEVAFDETPLGDVVERLGRRERLNIDVRWRVLAQVDVDRDTPVTVERLTHVRLSTALRAILASIADEPGQLGVMVDGELLVLSTVEDLRRSLEVRVYDVHDLLHDTPDFSQTSGGGLGGYGRGSGGYGAQGGAYGGYGGRTTGRTNPGGPTGRSSARRGGFSGAYSTFGTSSRTQAAMARELEALIAGAVQPETWRGAP